MSQFKPMLAAMVDDVEKLSYPLLASPKLDGIRCIVRGGKALSRSLKPIPNKHIRETLELDGDNLEGIDGELIVPGTTFQETTSAVMSHEGKPAFVLYAFDASCDERADEPFQDRLVAVSAMASAFKFVQLVIHQVVNSAEQLLEFERECLARGYEGVMLRDPNGRYKRGRSTLKEGLLMKLKRFSDAECRVIAVEEKMHNANEAFTDELGRTKRSSAQAGKVPMGVLGAFVCEDLNGVRFNVGSGLTDEQRKKYWEQKDKLVGKLLKYKSLETGKLTAPRHPVFLGFRDARDL